MSSPCSSLPKCCLLRAFANQLHSPYPNFTFSEVVCLKPHFPCPGAGSPVLCGPARDPGARAQQACRKKKVEGVLGVGLGVWLVPQFSWLGNKGRGSQTMKS